MVSDDGESWNELVQSVVPLKKDARDTSRKAKKLVVTPKISAGEVYSGDALDELEFGKTANIDANTAKRFRSGSFKIEDELDLHGCTENIAFERVINFIKNAYISGKRCVAIITGKGLHVENEIEIFKTRGVLKERVPQWLNLPEIRPLILAIDHPQQKDGGSGVIRILLRRRRG
jgi:DNA-nicking Smr family endonuclease